MANRFTGRSAHGPGGVVALIAAGPSRVLIAITGLTPAVVTETLYALAAPPAGTPAWVPDEVVVVTSRMGCAMVEQPPKDRGHPLRDVLGWMRNSGVDSLKGLPAKVTVHAIAHDDIDTPEATGALTDMLVKVYRSYALHAGCEIHLSAAGGRNGMGWLAAQVAGLLGRSQDKASQVLVNWPYDSDPGFYYPGQPGHMPEGEVRRLVWSAAAGQNSLVWRDTAVGGPSRHAYAAARLALVDLPVFPIQPLLSQAARKVLDAHVNEPWSRLASWLREFLSARTISVESATFQIQIQTDSGEVVWTILGAPYSVSLDASKGDFDYDGDRTVIVSRADWAFLAWLGWVTSQRGAEKMGGADTGASKLEKVRVSDAFFIEGRAPVQDDSGGNDKFDLLVKQVSNLLYPPDNERIQGDAKVLQQSGAGKISSFIGDYSTQDLASISTAPGSYLSAKNSRLNEFKNKTLNRRLKDALARKNPFFPELFSLAGEWSRLDFKYTHLRRFVFDGEVAGPDAAVNAQEAE